MPRVKKISPSVIAAADARVKKSPRGAPETIHPSVELEGDVLVEDAAPEAIPEIVPEVVPKSEPPCALDAAPLWSKVIMQEHEDGRKAAVLITPDGERLLPADDIAWTLPKLARVQRLADGFIAVQLGAEGMRPDLKTESAREAIAQFVPHFHR